MIYKVSSSILAIYLILITTIAFAETQIHVEGGVSPVNRNVEIGLVGSPQTVVVGYEIVQASSTADSADVKMVRVFCPKGKKVFGGGYTINGITANGNPAAINNLVPTSSLLFSNAGPDHNDGLYLVEVREIVPNNGDWSVTGQAVCGVASN